MKKLVSFLLGAVLLFGAATLGLPSASVSAKDKDKHDKNYWRKHHRKHHRRHRRHEHRTNKLSY